MSTINSVHKGWDVLGVAGDITLPTQNLTDSSIGVSVAAADPAAAGYDNTGVTDCNERPLNVSEDFSSSFIFQPPDITAGNEITL